MDPPCSSTASSKSPWNVSKTSEPNVSFTDLMSEQLAMSIQEENEGLPNNRTTTDINSESVSEEDHCSNDQLLAMMLQRQFDREHDTLLEKEQKHYNGNNKVSVSFDQYKSLIGEDYYFDDDESSDDEAESADTREALQLKLENRKEAKFGPSGVMKVGDNFVSKHDKVICGRKNASRVMQFPPEFQTGDGMSMDIILPNHVYNTLKSHSMSEERRLHRIHEKKEKSTAELAIDSNTRLLLYKMVNGGLLDSISGSISTGKEANVLHAFGGKDSENVPVPSECAIKVYKTTLHEFKNRGEYVHNDYRFKNPRKVLKVWAEKEMFNLNRLKRSNIPCPQVVKLRKHVLVMSFIGKDQVPAPKLKDASLEGDDLRSAYDQCVDIVNRMYKDCKLVHGDLSEFNILWWEGQCYFIDVGQAVDLSHPRCLQFLVRDCLNMMRFFARHGLEPCMSARELFTLVTGIEMHYEDEQLETEIQAYSVRKSDHLQTTKDRLNPADYHLRTAIEDNARQVMVTEG